MKRIHSLLISALTLSVAANVRAGTTVTVDPLAPWNGFMNVFEIPAHGGGYVFGSGWGTVDPWTSTS